MRRRVSVHRARRAPKRACVLLGVALASAVLAPPVRATPADSEARSPEARGLYEDGLRLYKVGKYDEALAKLRASYALVPAVGLLYDLAQVYRLQRNCGQARDLYRQFLDQSAGGPANTIAKSHLAEMETCLADTPADVAPARPVALPPVPPPVVPVAGNLISVSAAASTPAKPARRWRVGAHRATLVAGAAALALSAAAGLFAWRAERDADQVSASFLPGQQWNAGGMSAQQAGQTSQTLEIATAAGALLSGGIALWLAARD